MARIDTLELVQRDYSDPSRLEERFKARSDAMKDPEWQAYLAKGPPLLAEMHSTLLIPTNYSPLK